MLTLVIGGSASGKSAFAERLAVQSGLPRFYVATMRVWDTESERRVARHRDMRRERLHRQCAHLIVVSNEVFRGGADYAGDTARYLLALARVNNAVAARADHVCRVVCGLPRWVKGGDEFGRA